MKKISFTIPILLVASLSPAQSTFQKTYGGIGDNQGYCVQQTSDGGYIAVASSNGLGLGYTDIFIIRTDSAGDTLWTKSMGSNGIDELYSVRETADGGFIFGGVFAPPPSYAYAFLMKTDAGGNILWSKAYGNTYSQDAECAQQTSDGGYILCGNLVNNGTSNDYLLLKTDSAGSITWCKCFGSTGSDFAIYLEQTIDGGYVFTGRSGPYMEIIKTDVNGNLQWSKNYGSVSSRCIHQTADGGYAVIGYSWINGLGGDDIFLMKTDSTGNLLWSRHYGGVNGDRGYSFSQTTDGGYIITGTTSMNNVYNLLLIKTDSAGGLLWTKVFGSSDYSGAGSVQQTTDGGYAVLGKYGSINSSIFLIKTDSSGENGCQTDTFVFVLRDTSVTTTPGSTAITAFIGDVVPAMTVIQPPISLNSPCLFDAVQKNAEVQNEIIVTPNPSNGNFTVSLEDIKGKIEIVNTYGKKIFSDDNFNNKKEFKLEKISSGVYFVKIIGEKILTKKILIVQ